MLTCKSRATFYLMLSFFDTSRMRIDRICLCSTGNYHFILKMGKRLWAFRISIFRGRSTFPWINDDKFHAISVKIYFVSFFLFVASVNRAKGKEKKKKPKQNTRSNIFNKLNAIHKRARCLCCVAITC